MKLLTKYTNISIFVFCLILLVLFKNNIHISTDFLSILPDNVYKERLEIYNKFKGSKELYIAVKGFDKESFGKIKQIEKTLSDNKYLILKSDMSVNSDLEEYKDKYRFFIGGLDKDRLDLVSIEEKLTQEYELLNTSLFYSIDEIDPLGIFMDIKQDSKIATKNGHLILEDFGYLSIFTIDTAINTLEQYQNISTFIDGVLTRYDDVRYFSPIFYYVENSSKIRNDVNILVFASVIILSILYIKILKNINLLLNTVATLLTSMMISFLLLGVLFNDISVFVLAFGVAISTIAIDYMFHHYMHDNYGNNKVFNTSVFFGFLTTVLVFVMFSLIDFPLIRQLSVFASVSLIVSYFHFAFLYPIIGFKKQYVGLRLPEVLKINYKLVSIISIVVICIGIVFSSFDTNLKNLDYQNIKLLNEEKFFSSSKEANDYALILLQERSIDDLIALSKSIKQQYPSTIVSLAKLVDKNSFNNRTEELSKINFEELRKNIELIGDKIGYNDNLFSNAYSKEYLSREMEILGIDKLRDMGFDVVYHNDKYYTTALMPKNEIYKLQGLSNIFVIDSLDMFKKSFLELKNQLITIGILILVTIFGILYATCKDKFIVSASFVLFPIATIVGGIFLVADITILHLFALFMVIALSIDYGIYIARDMMYGNETKDAILFSLLSTFAGFGVLIFSQVEALHIIGLVTCVGITAILILLTNKKRAI